MHDEVGNDLSFPALHLGTRKLFLQKRSNQTMSHRPHCDISFKIKPKTKK